MASSRVRAGELNVHNKGIFKKPRKHFFVLHAATRQGKARLEQYENVAAAEGKYPELIICEADVVKVEEVQLSVSDHICFMISTRDSRLCLSVPDDNEIRRRQWIRDIEKTLVSSTPSPSVSLQAAEVDTYNDIYVSSEEYSRKFKVHLSKDTMKKFGEDKDLSLRVESGAIVLMSSEGLRLGRWPIEYLRRFGYTEHDFHFEAGRRTEHGPGLFSFKTSKGREIHHLITKEKSNVRNLTSAYEKLSLLGNSPMESPLSAVSKTPPGAIPVLPSSKEARSLLTLDGHHYEDIVNMKGNTPTKGSKEPETKPFEGRNRPVESRCTAETKPLLPENIYYTPEFPTDAWKTHGLDTTESDYAELKKMQSKIPESTYEFEGIPGSHTQAKTTYETVITQRPASVSSNDNENFPPAKSVRQNSSVISSEPVYALPFKRKKEITKL